MRQTCNTYIVRLLLITSFLLLKVVNLHGFEHFSDNDKEVDNCKVCILHHYKEDKEPIIFLSDIPEFTPFVFLTTKFLPSEYVGIKIQYLHKGCYFNRPPPTRIS